MARLGVAAVVTPLFRLTASSKLAFVETAV
jgi:hypothetical protein